MQKSYVIPIVALVLVVGGLAWVAQYLPNTKKGVVRPDPPPADKKLVSFTLTTAEWEKRQPAPDKETKEPKEQPASDPFRHVETGDKGHYDFFFKNLDEHNIEASYFASDCDCTSVKACVLPTDEWDRLAKAQAEKPGEDLSHSSELKWHQMPPDPARNPGAAREPGLAVKSGQRGVIRVEWHAKKTAAQELKIRPQVHFQRVGDPSVWTRAQLVVPIKISPPVQFYPARIVVPTLTSGKSVKKFDAWSSTRATFKLSLDPLQADPHFVFEVREYPKEKCAALEAALNANSLDTRVRSACEVTLTVYETKDGRQLDQGAYYRKRHVTLDGQLQTELFGPEIVGRVKGEIQIGGAEDQGRIRFKSFDISKGSSKEVQLAANANIKLVTHESFDTPSWVKVKLTSDKEKPGAAQRVWYLEVTVLPNTIGARSFEEPDAITLRIEGTPERFVRIPLDGHISGQ